MSIQLAKVWHDLEQQVTHLAGGDGDRPGRDR